MRLLPVSVIAASIALMAGLPAAGQFKRSLNSVASVRFAAVNDSAADKDTYVQKARDEVREWRRKLHDISAKARVKATTAHNAAANDLDKAWTQTEAASRRLENAGADDWQSAKASFRKASRKLAIAWRKMGPKNK